MGVLSFLFGKSGSDPEASAASAAADTEGLPSAEEWKDPFGWFADQLRAFGQQCERVGLRVDRPRSECELRAMWRGHPIRIELDENGHGAIELSFVNRRGHLCLIAHEGEMIEGEFHRPPNETVNLSVGAGVSLQTSARFVEDDRRTFEGLPAPMRARMLERTRAEQRTLTVRHQTVWANIAVWPRAGRTIAGQLEDELADIAEIARVLADGPALVDSRAGGDPQRTQCPYCQTRFVVEVSDPRCPSCGAAAR